MSSPNVYRCELCDYNTCRKFNLIKHNKTEKHLSQLLGDVPTTPFSSLTSVLKVYRCSNCNRKYNAKRSVWRHMKLCKKPPVQTSTVIDLVNTSSNMTQPQSPPSMTELLQKNQEQIVLLVSTLMTMIKSNPNLSAPDSATRSNQQQQQQLIPTAASTATDINGGSVSINGNQNNVNAPTTKNSNNKTYNMNMFLNEKCKDAMNITEFANGIELNNEDMEDVGTHGFVKGISKILMDNLEKTDITMRPIHCTDHKREVMAVKEENKWERTSLDCKKLIDVVRVIEKKNLLLINQWAEEHPECSNSDTSANRMYMKLHKNADGDDASISKVLKNVAKKVYIDKDELAELCE